MLPQALAQDLVDARRKITALEQERAEMDAHIEQERERCIALEEEVQTAKRVAAATTEKLLARGKFSSAPTKLFASTDGTGAIGDRNT